MMTIWQDVRYAFRQLCKSPVFAAVAVLSLALGIGANTAIFSVINGVRLKSLPVRDPHELRVVNWTSPRPSLGTFRSRDDDTSKTIISGKFCSGAFPYPAYCDFAAKAKGFSDVFAFSSFSEERWSINAGGIATTADGLMVSGNFFDGYGARILIGRPIVPQDDRPGADPVAVITYRLWQRSYGFDPHVVGQILTVNGIPFTVIGVLPRYYMGPLAGDPTEFYIPMAVQPQLCPDPTDAWLTSFNHWYVQIMGRLEPGADDAQARASLEVLFNLVLSVSDVEMEQPAIMLQDGRHGLMLSRQEMAQPLWVVQGVVGLVLLIACANLASLLLARGAGRQHEMAVRAAIGAGRWRLMRQSLTESLVLSLMGAGLGLVLSVWIKAVVAGFVTVTRDNQHFNFQIDANVLMFTLTTAFITTLLCGFFPALRAGSADPSAGLKDSGTRGTPRLRLGKILVAAQVGLSVLLVMGAGLLTQTLVNLYRVDPGFDAENLLLFRLNPLESVHKWEDLDSFYGTVRERIAGIPGVRSVTLSDCSLLTGFLWRSEISIPGRPGERSLESRALSVNDEFFKTMGIGLLSGRPFNQADNRSSQHVAIVNEVFARKFFPDENPLGKSFKRGDDEYQIVGLCRNHRYHIRREPSPIIYFSCKQLRWRRMTFAVRSVLPPLSLVPAIRKTVAGIDRNLPLDEVTTQVLLLKKSVVWERLFALLCGSLALLALLLSCIGIFGLMAYNVTRRTGEMGIRMALGARPREVAWPILREALVLTVLGIAVGMPVALVLTRLVRGFLFGIEAYDPVTVGGATTVLFGVAALAAWIPARRAAKINPIEALRYE